MAIQLISNPDSSGSIQLNGNTAINFTSTGIVTLPNTSTLSITNFSYSGELTTTSVSALQVPVGTTAQRPSAANGKIRYNTTLGIYEGYNSVDAAWSTIGGDADPFTNLELLAKLEAIAMSI